MVLVTLENTFEGIRMGDVYIVIRYSDDIEDKGTDILGVYSHEEQAMIHTLEYALHDSIGGCTEMATPPTGYIFDAEVKGDKTRRICIVKSQITIGLKKHNGSQSPERRFSIDDVDSEDFEL